MKKRILSILLSLCMVLTLAPQAAFAGTGTDSTPSVTAYATKDQLIDGTFAPNSNVTASNIGKLVFGKNSSGQPQEWYILDKDDGVAGDNTVIFAASPMVTGQIFSPYSPHDAIDVPSDSNAKYVKNITIQPYLDITYIGINNTEISKVYINHYGTSDLRMALRLIAGSTNHFTEAEQVLMNATTVTTTDMRQKSLGNDLSYTTTDKLYAPASDDFDESVKTIKAGSGDQKTLADSYWSGADAFWLRSPNPTKTSEGSSGKGFWHQALFVGKFYETETGEKVYGGDYVISQAVTKKFGVRPASNIDLSSVSFASAAIAASSGVATSGTIEQGKAMTLRLDGSSKNIGTVTYSTATGDIKATKGSTTGDVALVVQGNDGAKDWYYSKKIDTSESINASDIKSTLNLSSDIDLSACKIWLETTEDNVAYAVSAKEAKAISSVGITGINTPEAGVALDTEATCETTGVSNTKPAITWAPNDSTAGYNTSYTASVTLTAGTGYEFTNSTAATVNSNAATSVTKKQDGTLTVTYAFPATAKRKITGVTAPTVPTNNTFTTYYGYDGYTAGPVSGSSSELGTQATVTFEGTMAPTEESMNVTWTIANDGGAGYDKTLGATNTFMWTIPASELTNYNASGCPGYDTADGTITGTVTITNKAATSVSITGTDRSISYTGAAIDVSSYFNIDTNAGAATYSLITGADGGTGVGSLDGTALTVTRTGTFKIKVNTAANGIYAAGKETITLTVSKGTIDYTAADYSGTYDGQAHSISVNVTKPEGTTVTYSTDGKAYGSANPSFTNAGTYAVYYRIMKDNYTTVEASKTVTINKKAVSITAQAQSIIWGNSINRKSYNVSENGIVAGDRIVQITLTPSTTDLTDDGTITISGVKIENAAGVDVTGSYNITTFDGTLKIAHNTALAPDRIEAVKTKKSYISGEKLNVDDITVTAHYADGYSGTVTGFETNAKTIDMSLIGEKTLTVSYTKNDETKTKDITITVSHNTSLAPQSIDAVKNKTSYISGDTLNVDDITVTAYYADGYSEAVAEFTTNAAGLDMSRAGEKTLTVSYSKNGETRTADISITVTAAAGGGGGGGGYIPPVQKPIVKNDDNATTSADLNDITSTSGGTTTANIDKAIGDEIVDKAVENKSEEIVIDATAKNTTAADSTTTTQVGIPTNTLGAIAEKTEADVTVKTDVAEIKMDNTAAGAIAKQASGDTVQIIVEKVNEKKNKVEFQLKVVCSDGNVISDFKGGNVAVTITVPKDLAEKKVVCVFIDDNGRMSKVKGQKNADGTYTFITGHFSTYALMTEEEADTAIAAQKEEILARLDSYELVARSMACKSPSGKNAIRIRVSDKNGLNTEFFDGIEIYRSTKKNTGYGKKPIFVTKSGKSYYYNTAIKSGTKYYYRVRGFVIIDGQKYYTDYSLKAIRTAK